MNSSVHELHCGGVANWFPLLPRARPRCQPLSLRVAEISDLARSASCGTNEQSLLSAAEAHNKAALIASDCGLTDLAQQLCWRQFDIFRTATPLAMRTAKLALQPVVNLGRLFIRDGQGARAYQIFQSIFDAISVSALVIVDGRSVDFGRFAMQVESLPEVRRFLWTVLLADGTRALAKAGRWDEALRHVERYKGIGRRMLDGRQVAILGRCAAGDCDGAIALLNDSLTPDAWEAAVAAYLRSLCLSIGDRPLGSSVAVLTKQYLQLDSAPGQHVFNTRLGLSVLAVVGELTGVDLPEVVTRIVREAVVAADAYAAWDVVSDSSGHLNMTKADREELMDVVESSGLHRGSIPADLLDELMEAVASSETHLSHILQTGQQDLAG